MWVASSKTTAKGKWVRCELATNALGPDSREALFVLRSRIPGHYHYDHYFYHHLKGPTGKGRSQRRIRRSFYTLRGVQLRTDYLQDSFGQTTETMEDQHASEHHLLGATGRRRTTTTTTTRGNNKKRQRKRVSRPNSNNLNKITCGSSMKIPT